VNNKYYDSSYAVAGNLIVRYCRY